MVQKEYKKKGIVMKKDKIERNLLEKAAHNWAELDRDRHLAEQFQHRSERQAIFEKNYKKS